MLISEINPFLLIKVQTMNILVVNCNLNHMCCVSCSMSPTERQKSEPPSPLQSDYAGGSPMDVVGGLSSLSFHILAVRLTLYPFAFPLNMVGGLSFII